ncbi:DUF4192 domain-containing protein [Micromonospora sp. I033]
MNSTERPRLAVRSPADLVAAVPYLLGFHPADSVVVVAVRGRRVVFAARGDLPEPGRDPRPPARHLAEVVARQGTDAATVIGYGPALRVTGAVDAVGEALDRAGLLVLDALRVTDGRWWSYLCAEPSCCPPEGTPYDPAASQVSAAAVFAGQVALPDRAALAAQVPPERGERLADDEVAWLTVLLTHLPVRDHAWARTDGRDADIGLWTDVLRRAEPELVAAPGCLLAFAAWRAGHGALAAVAVERVLAAQPGYSLAVLLDDALRRGLSPAELDGWPATAGPAVLRRRRRRPGR